MISQKILNLLKNNNQIKEFFSDNKDIEILFKKLNQSEIKRLSIEYPNLLDLKNQYEEIKKQTIKTKDKESPILCLTLIKCDNSIKNYMKLKKIKLYIDEMDEKIIKILQN